MTRRLVLVLCLAACTSSPTTTRLPVVATVYPLQEFARWVGGERVQVTLLTPPGAESHSWEPTPRELSRLYQARLLFFNGAGLEPWVERFLATGPPPSLRALETTRGLDLIHANGRPDPHVWLDPLLAAGQVETIRSALSQADPEGAPLFEANAGAARARLEALDQRFRKDLAACRSRGLVVSHEAFRYLARRYGLTVIALAGLSPEVEPGPARLAQLVGAVRRAGARTVFVESLTSPRLAETVAREVGAQIRRLNPIEGLTEAEARAGQDYWSLMEGNLEALRAGLGCE